MSNIKLEYLYTVQEYVTFHIYVQSGNFSGESNFCMPKKILTEAIVSLSNVHENLKGSYQINDYDSDDYILFKMLKLGHMEITGQVGGSYNDQFLRYQFECDQTDLLCIIQTLKEFTTRK